MKIKKIFFPLLFFLAITVGYYFSYNNTPDYIIKLSENNTVKSVVYDESKVSESFGFGVYRSYNPLIGMNLTRFLKENESFEGYIKITNAINEENQYLLFALVDYRITPFYINGIKNQTHLINLSPMQDNLYPFKIDNLSFGYHDLLLGVFLNPYEHSLKRKYRMSTDFALMGSKRLNIIVGNGSIQRPEFKNLGITCESSYVLEGLLVNMKPCSTDAWLTENVTKMEKLEYFINIGNTERRNQRTFAVIQFLDYKQIPIKYNTSEYAYFGYLNKGKKGSIQASLSTPNSTGVSELIVVWISDPYENLDISPGIRNLNLEGRVEPSIRVGLNVVKK